MNYKFNNRTDTFRKSLKHKKLSKIKLMKKFDKFSCNFLNTTIHLEKDMILSAREMRLKEKREEEARDMERKTRKRKLRFQRKGSGEGKNREEQE